MAFGTALLWVAAGVLIGLGLLRLLQPRIDAAIDRALPDPHWY